MFFRVRLAARPEGCDYDTEHGAYEEPRGHFIKGSLRERYEQAIEALEVGAATQYHG